MVDVEFAPYALVRFNPIAGPAPVGRHHAVFDEIDRLAVERRRLTPAVLERLYALAAEVPDDVRLQVVLPSSRAVFNDRDPRVPPERLAAEVPDLVRWHELRRAERERLDEAEALVAAVLTEERDLLRAVLGHEDFLRAAAISSPDLARSAARYAATPPAQQPKRVRKSEPKLIRYALRAIAKTSPFSHYTVIGMGRWRPGAPPDPADRAVRVEPSLLLLLRLLDAATADPAALPVSVRLAEGVVRTDAGFEFEVMRDDPQRSRVYRTRRSRVCVPASGATRYLVDGVGSGARPVQELAAALAQRSGQPVATAYAYIGRLLSAGLLTVDLRVDQHASDPALRLAEDLRALGAPAAVELAECVAGLHRRTVAVAGMESGDRPAAIDALRAAWDAAFARYGTSSLTDSPLYEDVALAGSVDVDPRRWAAVRDDLRSLIPALEPLNMDHPGQALMTLKVVDKLGPGGSCAYPEFVAMLPDVFTTEQVTLAAMLAEIGGRDPGLDELLAVRERYLHQVATADGPEVVLSPEFVAGMAAGVPRRFRREHASFSVFVQAVSEKDAVVDRAAVNAVLDGNGGFLSRFLELDDDGITATLREHLRRTLPAGATELRPVQGFNANVHPALLDRQFRTFDGADGIDPGTLRVRHDPVEGRLVLEDADGRRVLPKYLGFLVPYLLPWELTGLYLLSAPSQLRIDAAGELERRLGEADRTGIRAYPRVRYGSLILSRRRWIVPAPLLPVQGPAESDAWFLARFDAFRAAHGIPARVFVARLGTAPDGGEADALGRPKPMYADLRSPLHLRCLPAWVADAPTLRIEEATPDPAAPPADPLTGRRATEYLIECSQTEGGDR
ncbi:lantibiotic dehydratase [Hamadaea tsunoensis]|uniref:lantibiotic dehydratase n=1 Tax=Hamadaea tsunoensis TaxID=53368 RepID=UPI000414435A|nr:lantibiotic dehydratase [Hamadaea tsunoensis]